MSKVSDTELVEWASRDPQRLVNVLKSDLLRSSDLTFAAEAAGAIEDSDIVRDALCALLKHESPLVREGAIYGLVHHLDDSVVVSLRRIVDLDPSPGVRDAAADALGECDEH